MTGLISREEQKQHPAQVREVLAFHDKHFGSGSKVVPSAKPVHITDEIDNSQVLPPLPQFSPPKVPLPTPPNLIEELPPPPPPTMPLPKTPPAPDSPRTSGDPTRGFGSRFTTTQQRTRLRSTTTGLHRCQSPNPEKRNSSSDLESIPPDDSIPSSPKADEPSSLEPGSLANELQGCPWKSISSALYVY